MTEASAIFERDRYLVLPSLLKEPGLSQYYRYACKVASEAGGNAGDSQVPGTPAYYCNIMMEVLLDDLLPEFERASGRALFQTYSYFRVYKHGDALKRHTDRPSCEISVSLCLGFEGAESWPIWIEGPKGTSPVSLNAGDALLYRGIECPHWRETFTGERQAQVFLHYVDQNGLYREWKYDKRKNTGRVS